MAKVKIINGTSATTCKCGSWFQHWTQFSGLKATYCSEIFCIRKDLIGSHVQRVGSTDNNRYIVPLCQEHNNSIMTLDVGSTVLVSANEKLTCAKSKFTTHIDS